MIEPKTRKDVVVLVADKDMESTLQGLLVRHRSLETRPIEFTVYRHPGRDSGCRTQGVPFLRSFCNQFEHAMLIFDHEGSGGESASAEKWEQNLEARTTGQRLGRSRRRHRTRSRTRDLGLERFPRSRPGRWMGRTNSRPSTWLVEEGYLDGPAREAQSPQGRFHHASLGFRKQPSSSLFTKLAQSVGFRRCHDRSIHQTQRTLQEWCPKADRVHDTNHTNHRYRHSAFSGRYRH